MQPCHRGGRGEQEVRGGRERPEGEPLGGRLQERRGADPPHGRRQEGRRGHRQGPRFAQHSN